MTRFVKSFPIAFGLILLSISCSNVDLQQKSILIDKNGLCGLTLGIDESSISKSFRKIVVYNEEGESYKYSGRTCEESILVELFVFNKKLNKLSIIDEDFCASDICIGDTFKKTREQLTDPEFYFGGEDGGIFSLFASNEIAYVFSKENIKISCYLKPEDCEDRILEARLVALVLSQ